jgi:flagellar hook-associated protein 3
MRITDSAIISDFLSSINRSKSRINRLNTQLAKNQKILKVSDDPITASTLLRLNEDLDRVTAYKSNVVDGQNSLRATAESLSKMSDLIGEVKTILTGSLGSGDATLLNSLAAQVDDKQSFGLNEIANAQFDRKYLFGGTQTTAPPYVRTGTPARINYQGNSQAIQYPVGDGVSQIVNVSGAAAFGSTGFIDLSGVLDRNAAINTVVNQTVQIADGNGVAHNVTMSMRKTDGSTWSISAAMPPGATDANLSGGTATVTFDPVTGAMKNIVRGSALVLSPTGATAAQTPPPVNMLFTAVGLTEGTPAGGSAIGGTQRDVSIFNMLADISTNLRNGIKPTADDMAILNTMQDVVMREAAKAGAYSSNLTTAGDFLATQNEHLQALYSSKQDVDIAEIGIRLTQEQVMLDAALSAAAKLIPKSLVDFLT